MAKKHSKRFYKNVSTEKSEDGWIIKLDTFILKTPGKKNLYLPNQDLSLLVANEWDKQDEYIRPSLMPLTRLFNVAVEQTPNNRQILIAEARKYGETDTLCYREDKVRLHREEQEKKWSPILEWAASRSVFLKKTTSIMAIKQEESSLIAIEKYASKLCNLKLTLFLHFFVFFVLVSLDFEFPQVFYLNSHVLLIMIYIYLLIEIFQFLIEFFVSLSFQYYFVN